MEVLQCDRRTQLAGSSARFGPLKTMATTTWLRISSTIDGLDIQEGDVYEDPFKTDPSPELQPRQKSIASAAALVAVMVLGSY